MTGQRIAKLRLALRKKEFEKKQKEINRILRSGGIFLVRDRSPVYTLPPAIVFSSEGRITSNGENLWTEIYFGLRLIGFIDTDNRHPVLHSRVSSLNIALPRLEIPSHYEIRQSYFDEGKTIFTYSAHEILTDADEISGLLSAY